LLVPSPVLGEVGYLLQSRVGPAAEVRFLQSFGDDGFHVAELADEDVPRTPNWSMPTLICRCVSSTPPSSRSLNASG
jgi:hypothetical protein